MVKDNGYLAFAFLVLGVVLLSWVCSGCELEGPAQSTEVLVPGDAGVEDAGECVLELIPCPQDVDEAFTCGCDVPCTPEALAAWCGV